MNKVAVAVSALTVAIACSAAVGVLIVSGDERPAPLVTPTTAAVEVPVGDPGPEMDRRAELARIAEEDSTGAAAAQMLAWVEDDDTYARACHNDAHMLGALGARREGGAAVIGYATSACDYGFIHGVLKAVALDSPTAVDPNALAELCALAPADIVASCDHGLGHAIPLRDNLSYSEGVAMCLQLDGDDRQAQCVNGVMMEFGVNYMYFHDLRTLDPGSLNDDGTLTQLVLTDEERRSPCTGIAEVGSGALDICYRHVHYFWSPELGDDYAEFERRCLEYVDDRNRSCLQSLGAWVWYDGELWADDPVEAHKAAIDASCMALASEDGRQWCIYGYLHTIWQSEPNPQSIPSLCEYLGPRYEPGCSSSEQRFRPTG